MHNTRFITLFIALIMSTVAIAQPRSISKIVDKNSISEEDERKIEKFALGWAALLQTTDAEELEQARSKLVDPFEPDVRMTPYARSLYSKYLEEGFEPLLSQDNVNEMAAVNALQILSLLGTESAFSVLLHHADEGNEKRPALRLWASSGLGTSFLTGEFPTNRIEENAGILSDYIVKEQKWYVLARLFDSLASLQDIPNLDRDKRNEFEELSFGLQANSLANLLNEINASDGDDLRVQALPFILPSLHLQLKPSVNEDTKSNTLHTIVPPLIAFVEFAVKSGSAEENTFLHNSYGGAAYSASLLITRGLGLSGNVRLNDLWNSGDYPAILELVETWKAKQ